jgi:hypothetical protein
MGTLGAEKPPEAVNDAADEIRQLMKEWQDRLTLKNLRLADRYRKGEIVLIVHFTLGDAKFAAHLQRAEGSDGFGESAKVAQHNAPSKGGGGRRHGDGELLGNPWGEGDADAGAPEDGHPDGEQQAVLVNVVQFVENPEVVSCATLVRFGSEDGIYRGMAHSLYSSVRSGFVYRGGGVVKNRKIDMATFASEHARADRVQGEGQVVEGAPQVVDGVSGDETRRAHLDY